VGGHKEEGNKGRRVTDEPNGRHDPIGDRAGRAVCWVVEREREGGV